MIKSKLLASTMLVSAAALVSAGNANAVALKLGGFLELWAGIGDQDKSVNVVNGFDIKQDAEIFFQGEETLDNGIKVGARFEMEAGNGNDVSPGAQGVADFDESFGWVKTKWGQINMGANDLASAYVGGVDTVGPVGITKSDVADWIPGTYTELNNSDVDIGTGDSNNITYFTPRVAGVQLIVSYTPDNSDNDGSDYDDQESAGFHDAWSGAVRYNGKFGGVSLGVAAGYTNVSLEDTNVAGSGSDTGTGYNLTIEGGFGPVNLSAAYAYEDNVADHDQYWAVSALYKMGNNAISVAYASGWEDSRNNGRGRNESELITVGVEHTLGKGASLAASVFSAEDIQQGAGTKETVNGWGAVGGLVIKF